MGTRNIDRHGLCLAVVFPGDTEGAAGSHTARVGALIPLCLRVVEIH